MSWKVAQVPPTMALMYLPCIRALMEGKKFPELVLHTADDIVRLTMDGKLVLFIFFEDEDPPFLFAAVRVTDFPQGRVATVVLAAGERIRTLLSWMPNFEKWCRFQECDFIVANVSLTFAKIVRKKYGYKARQLVLYKSLRASN